MNSRVRTAVFAFSDDLYGQNDSAKNGELGMNFHCTLKK